jgi:imidazolonepropionase-like amidohydrolase
MAARRLISKTPSIRIFALCTLTLIAGLSSFLASSRAAGNVFAIRDARIVTVSGAVIPKGTVVVRDGRIAAVGESVTVPGDAQSIDATGLSVYPGMIDSGTTLGLVEVSAVNATVDTTELGEFNANAKAIIAIHPESELIPVARANGITTVLTSPRGGLISGQCALINLDGWTPQEMALKATAAMRINYPALGFGGRGGGFGEFTPGPPTDQQRQQRDRQVEALRKKLEDAQAYAKALDAYGKDKNLQRRPVDLQLQALVPVVKGEMPILVTATREREMRGAIELADKYHLKLIISGANDALKVASLLKQKNVPVIIGPILELPNREDDPYDSRFAMAGELYKAGVKFAIQTNDASNVRTLPFHAGTAAAFGLPKEEALKAVTLYPAQIFGVDSMVGSIEPGKIANLVVSDGDILEFRTRIKHLFINGHPVDLSTRHTKLYDKYINRP